MELCYLFLRILPAKIAFLKFILEGHDGLALLSTVKNSTGLVRLAVPGGRYNELLSLLDALSPDLAAPVSALP